MHIVVVGLSHRTAPVEVREKLSIPDHSIKESLEALKAFSDVLEVSILSCLLYTSPSPRDGLLSRMPSSA